MMVVHNHERGDEPRTLRDEREVEIAKKWNALMSALYDMRDVCAGMVLCRRCPGRVFCKANENHMGFRPDALRYPDDEQEDTNDVG